MCKAHERRKYERKSDPSGQEGKSDQWLVKGLRQWLHGVSFGGGLSKRSIAILKLKQLMISPPDMIYPQLLDEYISCSRT